MSLVTQGFSFDELYDAPDPTGSLQLMVNTKDPVTPIDIGFSDTSINQNNTKEAPLPVDVQFG